MRYGIAILVLSDLRRPRLPLHPHAGDRGENGPLLTCDGSARRLPSGAARCAPGDRRRLACRV